jgi:hypothetical protein
LLTSVGISTAVISVPARSGFPFRPDSSILWWAAYRACSGDSASTPATRQAR